MHSLEQRAHMKKKSVYGDKNSSSFSYQRAKYTDLYL